MNKNTKTSENFLIKVQNLTKTFQKKLVFRNINLTIKPGDKIALLGVNGCGKTTLVEILLDLKSPTKGKVIYNCKKNDFLRNTTVVYQTGEYPRKLLVKDVIKLYENLFELKLDRPKIWKLMRILQIQDLKSKKINNLSFGQRKKLEAVLMLINPTQFLIIDELTSGIDINGRIQLYALFKELCQKNEQRAMIWITHDVEEISLCNRVIMMSKRNNEISLDMSLTAAKQKFKTLKNMVRYYIKNEIGNIVWEGH